MELYGYNVSQDKYGYLAIKPGETETGIVPDVALFVSDEFLKKENSKANPLKETRLLDLIYLSMLGDNRTRSANKENQDE